MNNSDFEADDVLLRLKAWGSLKVGDIPPNNWGPPLTKTLNDAVAEIEKLRAKHPSHLI